MERIRVKRTGKYLRQRVTFCRAIRGLIALEIGGPTDQFKAHGFLPIYRVLSKVDGCNFSRLTIWEGNITEGKEKYQFEIGLEKGQQFVCNGSNLLPINPCTYDVVLSSHVIEHFTNPLKALQEWKRVIRNDGYILIVAPHRDVTFDHRRPLTKFEHIVEDFEAGVDENDSTHLEEWIHGTDQAMYPGRTTQNEFLKLSMEFYENRSVHHHVFNTELVLKMIDYIGLEICCVDIALPHHIVVLGRKRDQSLYDNKHFFLKSARYKKMSPFRSDH